MIFERYYLISQTETLHRHLQANGEKTPDNEIQRKD